MSIRDSKVIRSRMMISTPLIDVNLDAKRDVLGEIFAARDQANREQRFAELTIKRHVTRPAGTPVKQPSRKIVRITDQRVKQIGQASTQPKPLPAPKQSPTPIKPFERAPNPFLVKHKADIAALFERIDRVIGSTPNQQPDTDSSNE